LAGRVADILAGTARAAARAWPLRMSLTAGLDSRVTLAACRDVRDRIDFFSHINPEKPNPGHQIDLDVARDMAGALGRPPDHRPPVDLEGAVGRSIQNAERISRSAWPLTRPKAIDDFGAAGVGFNLRVAADVVVAELIGSNSGLAARALNGSNEEIGSSVDIQVKILVSLVTDARRQERLES
jgi:hypothetical protein